MYEPTRGGTRGGQAEFKWTDVSADKDREVGQMTRFPSFFSYYANISLVAHSVAHLTSTGARCRIISAIPSTHQQDDGRRTRMSIGTTEMSMITPNGRRKSYGVSKKLKRRLLQLPCKSRGFSASSRLEFSLT